MKTILSVWHAGGKGKTNTLREFANLLLITYPSHTAIIPIPAIIPIKGNFRLVVEINGHIIGAESKGDPNTNWFKRLIDLADNYNCDIILCSSRTKGDTIKAVDNLYHTRNFQTIWTSTYQIDNSGIHTLVND